MMIYNYNCRINIT